MFQMKTTGIATTSEKLLVGVILTLSLIFWTVIAFLSEGSPEGGDAYIHYKFARYSFLYPELLLDHWGKPLYTALAAPFSQIGYFGAQLLNILLGTASAYLAWRITVILKLNHRPIVVILLLFTPYYTIVMLSALTEVLFSFTLILAVFLFLSKRYYFSAIVISFIPFARTEGFGMLPVFLVLLAFLREWRSIPFLLAGTLFYSIIGYFHFHDLFWVFSHTPYSQAGSELYGSGSIFYYFLEGKYIFGKPMMYLIGIGSLAMIYRLVKSFIQTRAFFENSELVSFTLIFGIFFGYIFVQSFLWSFGLMGVLASYRFMVCIMPLGAIIAMYGISLVPQKLFNRSFHLAALYLLIGFFVMLTPFRFYDFPWKHSPPQKVANAAAQWIKDEGLTENKIWYYDPIFFILLDLNPYDYLKSQEFPSNQLNAELRMPPGDIIIWDAHFGPNEGKTPLDRLMRSNQLELLNVFLPEVPFTVMGGRDYEIHIFQKTDFPVNDNVFLYELKALQQHFDIEPTSRWQLFYFNSFDNDNSDMPPTYFRERNIDNQAFVMSPNYMYFRIFEDIFSRFDSENNNKYNFSIEMNPINFNFDQDRIFFILSVENQSDIVKYLPIDMTSQLKQDGTWSKAFGSFELDDTDLSPELTTKLFFWYQGDGELLIDNPLMIKVDQTPNP